MSYRFREREPVRRGALRIAREEIDKAVVVLGDENLDRHERVHQARKRFKKIRALLRLLRGELGDTYGEENVWFRDCGRELAALAFVPVGVMGAVGNLGTGVLITRVPPRFLLAAQLLLLGAGLVLAGRLGSETTVWVYGAVIGLRNGMGTSLEGNVFAHYFGRRHIGAIRGQVATGMVVGSAIGPLVFAFGHDLTGTYAPVMLLAAVPAFALGLVAPFLRLRRGGRVR